jgi:phosphoribosylformylglycinamidine synthase
LKGISLIPTLYVRRIGDDPEALILLRRLKAEGFNKLKNLFIEKVFRLEGITQNQTKTLILLFCNPITESICTHSTLKDKNGPITEVGYQRAVTDPELPSILRGARSLGIKELTWARIAHRYQFIGIDSSEADHIVNRYLYNPQVQIIIKPGEEWNTLHPQGKSGPVEKIILNGLTKKDLNKLSQKRRLFLNADQMSTLQNIASEINRSLTDAELEMFAQTWSDHCFHTTWKSLGLLQALQKSTNIINHPLVLSSFEDNAGVMNFYDNWALTIKGETHNSPSAVSPYGGIMTKHGGVIRDTLGCGQGAKPIGGSTIMGLGDPNMSWDDIPDGALHPKTILLESIRGTADYNNPMGIPMMFPVYRFHNGYTGKCFALGHSIGIIHSKRCQKGKPLPGDIAILIGGPTGRDGLHGATVSSSLMTSKTSTIDAAHVQIGHPIEERKFMEAIPVLRDHDCIRAITDLGAAGLSSAAGEMASQTGIWINLAWVPLKTKGMLPWEIWISESQERMLLCIPKNKITKTLNLLQEYEVPAAIIGNFTATGRCQVIFDKTIDFDFNNLKIENKLSDEIVIDLDFKYLRKECPLPKINTEKSGLQPKSFKASPLQTKNEWISIIKKMVRHLNICDQSPAGAQFDSTVQGITVIGPYGGVEGRMPNDVWAAAPIRGKPFGVVVSNAYNPLYCDLDTQIMAKLMMIESITKLVTVGVNPNEIVLCDNFYTPHVTSEIAYKLKEMVLTCCNLSIELGTPFISGKDSSSGTFITKDGQRIDVPPTLCVLAMGRIPNVKKLIHKSWSKDGNHLFLLGPTSKHLGGSIYFDIFGHRGNQLPDPDISDIKNTWKTLQALQKDETIISASAISAGGILRRIFEMSLGSGLGCKIELSEIMRRLNLDTPETGLFSEMIGAVLIEVSEKNISKMKKNVSAIPIGRIIQEFSIQLDLKTQSFCFPMSELIEEWEKPFQEVAR